MEPLDTLSRTVRRKGKQSVPRSALQRSAPVGTTEAPGCGVVMAAVVTGAVTGSGAVVAIDITAGSDGDVASGAAVGSDASVAICALVGCDTSGIGVATAVVNSSDTGSAGELATIDTDLFTSMFSAGPMCAYSW